MTSELTTFDLPFRSFVPAYGVVLVGEFPADAFILAGNRGQLQQQLPLNKLPPKSTSLCGLALTLDKTLVDDSSVGSLTSEAVDGPLHDLSLCGAYGLSSKLLPLYLAASNHTTCTSHLHAPLPLASLQLYPNARGRPIYCGPQPGRPTSGRASQLHPATGSRKTSQTGVARPINTQAGPNKNQTQVLVVSTKSGVLQSAFGCLIGKYEVACQEAKCYWTSFRSLCRSEHLDRHRDEGDLNDEQLTRIRNATRGLNGHDAQKERWRDCFLELYPEFADRRADLNPYFGEPLLPGGEHPPTVFARLLAERINNAVAFVRDRPQNPLFQVSTPRLNAPRIAPALPAQIVPNRSSHGHSRLGGTSNRSREMVSLPENPRPRPPLPSTPSLTQNRPPFQETSCMSHQGREDRIPAPPSRRQASRTSVSDIDPSVIDPRLLSNQYSDEPVFSPPRTPQRRPQQVSATTPSMYTGDTEISYGDGFLTSPTPFFPPERHEDLVPIVRQDLALLPDHLLDIEQDDLHFQEDSGASSGLPSAHQLTRHHPGTDDPADPPMLYVRPDWLLLNDTMRGSDQQPSKKRTREATP